MNAFFASSFAQQDPMYSQYMFNALVVNPAYAGVHDNISASLLSRHQWAGFEGAPNTQTFTAHGPLDFLNIGLGFTFMRDAIGPTSQNVALLDYSYKLQLTETANLSVGLRSALTFFNLELNSLETTDVEGGLTDLNLNNKFLPNFGFGLYYEADDYYIGASAPRILKNKLYADNTNDKSGRLEQHFFVTGGYLFDIDPNVQCQPSVLGKFVDGAPVSVDLSANFIYQQQIWFGGFYRFGDAVGAMFQYVFPIRRFDNAFVCNNSGY